MLVNSEMESERMLKEAAMLRKEKEETMQASSSMVFSKVKVHVGRGA